MPPGRSVQQGRSGAQSPGLLSGANSGLLERRLRGCSAKPRGAGLSYAGARGAFPLKRAPKLIPESAPRNEHVEEEKRRGGARKWEQKAAPLLGPGPVQSSRFCPPRSRNPERRQGARRALRDVGRPPCAVKRVRLWAASRSARERRRLCGPSSSRRRRRKPTLRFCASLAAGPSQTRRPERASPEAREMLRVLRLPPIRPRSAAAPLSFTQPKAPCALLGGLGLRSDSVWKRPTVESPQAPRGARA